MGHTACTEPQCLYSRDIPLLPIWAIRPVQSLGACTRVHFTFFTKSTQQDVWLPCYLNRVSIVRVQDRLWRTVTIYNTNNIISGITFCYFTLVTCSGSVCVFMFCGRNCSFMFCFQYSCLWISVTCHDVAVTGLCGHFTQIRAHNAV
jgi:hypothetical protein